MTRVLSLINSRRYPEALSWLRKASKATPGDGWVWLLMGIAHGGLGAYERAAENFLEAIKRDPDSAEARYYLGHALQAEGKIQQAVKSYRKAVELRATYWEAHYAIARALQGTGDFGSAIAAYQAAIAINPGNSELHANLGIAFKATGRNSLAMASLKEAIRLQPGSAEAHFNLGNLHQGQRELDEAAACYLQATRLKPHWIEAQMAFSSTLLLQGEVEKALGVCRAVLDREPGNQQVAAMEASILEQAGDLDAAYQRLHSLVEAGTDQAAALVTYAKLASKFDKHGEVIELLQHKLGSVPYDRDDSRRLHFALADSYDAIGEYDQAFEHYQRGNALKSAKFDANAWSSSVEAIIRQFSSAFLESSGCAADRSRMPVFIVGMPRTGSTLLEQILSRHSEVYGAGELADIKNIALSLPGLIGTDLQYPECMVKLNQDVTDRVASEHVQRLAALSRGAARVIDKMPGNYLHLGLIQILFPGASVLHTTRDPLDTCLSCFTRDLGGGASFSADLRSLGLFYKGYGRLMDHWKEVLRLEVLEVRYEQLVGDLEGVIRGVVDFCGLDWEERCLDYLGNRRVVATPSYGQVRKPIYTSSIGKWKHYEKHLGPLIEVLES